MFDDVKVSQLKAVVAVAEEGTFLGAADVLHLTQSAISQQVARLEKEIGEPVFDRPGGPRAVQLTPVGEVVLRRARAILAQLEQGSTELDALIRGTGGRLRCGTFQSVSVQLLPAIISELIKESPGLDVVIEEELYNEDLIRRLLEGELDVAFHTVDLDEPELESITLGADPFVALIPEGSPITPKKKSGSIQLTDLVKFPMIAEFEDHQDPMFVSQAVRNLGISPRYAFRTSDNGAVQAMVGAGLGVAIMPALTLDPNFPGVGVWPIDPPIDPRILSVALPKGPRRTKAAQRFVELAKRIGRAKMQKIHLP